MIIRAVPDRSRSAGVRITTGTGKEHPIEALARLKSIVDRLRAPDGCPWDREQTSRSLKGYLLEEAHEVAEAIEREDNGLLCEELGDLLLNVFLQARIAEEAGHFTLGEVAERISEKLIRRHPHVFAGERAPDAGAVRVRWEELKRKERSGPESDPSVLRPLPASLPSLEKAIRVGRMAAEVGFDWPDANGPLAKIEEETREVRQSLAGACGTERLSDEVGDLLFAVASFCRHSGLDPERALHGSLERFRRRFRQVEVAWARQDPDGTRKPTLAELEALWQEAKREDDSPT